ncbi:multidrug efflux MFS transporter EmrD [Thaumasiovibrio subtropicus]|uniref:multidrug efflux MFS transporter EmrD n=1 Tax=Thaumasiovibrio subtropicus TaxID=1891207 RepID=UPI00192D00F3|nr:multidrug efflux MFS transporter EmrD [Thaumasiovibrio subtropicus]
MHASTGMAKLLFLVILMAGVGQMTQTMYVPAIGEMASVFGVPVGQLQAVMAAYLTSYGLTQFIYGPLSDRFGRKPVLMLGMAIFLCGSVLAISVNDFTLFLVASFIQGAGTGCCGAMCRTVTRDCYEGDDLQKANSLVSMGVIFSPLIAPVLGGWLATHWGWLTIYQFLLGFGICVTLVLMSQFPETLPAEKRIAQPVITRYKTVLSSRRFQGYILCLVAAFAGIAIYEAALGVLLGGVLQLSPQVVSILFILPLPGYLAGSWLSGALTRNVGADKGMVVGIIALVIGALVILATGLTIGVNAASLVIGGTFYFAGAGLTFPIATTAALAPFPQQAGTAGAIMGGMQNLGAGLATLAVAMFPAQDQNTLGLAMLLMTVIAVVGLKRVKRATQTPAVATA